MANSKSRNKHYDTLLKPLHPAENTKTHRAKPARRQKDARDENVDSFAPNRRSSRLNGTARTDSTTDAEPLVDKANVPVKRKITRRKADANQGGRKPQRGFSLSGDDVGGTPADEDSHSDAPSGLTEIRDLRRQLHQEKGFRHAIY
jgi:hypothetical protein